MKIDYEKVISKIDSFEFMCYPPHYPLISVWPAAGVSGRARLFKTASEYFKRPQKRELGLYLNIPFCASKCSFCFLEIVPYRETGLVEAFLKGLEAETALWGKTGAAKHAVSSVYMAGGTASILSIKALERVFFALKKNFFFAPDSRISLETGPDFVDEARAELFSREGVGLVMLGVQSFDQKVIKAFNRAQNCANIERAARLLKKNRVKFNVDLICGLNSLDEKKFLAEAAQAVSIGPDMIHLNKFKPVYEPARKNAIEKLQRKGLEFLASKGYRVLDEESAAKPGFPGNRQGDMDFQVNASAIGLGPGALGHIHSALRYKNYFEPLKYSALAAGGALPAEKTALLDSYDESVHYCLNKIGGSGVKLSELAASFEPKAAARVLTVIAGLSRDGIVRKKGGVYKAEGGWFEITRRLYGEKYLAGIARRFNFFRK